MSQRIVFGALIIVFLIAEPDGLVALVESADDDQLLAQSLTPTTPSAEHSKERS